MDNLCNNLFFQNSLSFQVQQFDTECNEAQFCTLRLKRKDTHLIGFIEAITVPKRTITTLTNFLIVSYSTRITEANLQLLQSTIYLAAYPEQWSN